MSKKVIVIGGGVAGLASAGLLAKKGYSVTLIEKNARIGGRANKFEAEGYTFDMGPSWYLMPDIFEHYFQLMGTTVSDHLDLKRLDPSYRIYFAGRKDPIDIHSDIERDAAMLEKLEPGSVEKLKPYIKRGGREYALAKK